MICQPNWWFPDVSNRLDAEVPNAKILQENLNNSISNFQKIYVLTRSGDYVVPLNVIKGSLCAHMLIVVALIIVKNRKPIYKKHITTYIKTYI